MHITSRPRLRKRALTAAYYTVFLLYGFSVGVWGPTMPALAERNNTDLAGIAVSVTVAWLGYFIGSSPGGWLVDRISGRMLITGAKLVESLATIAIPFIATPWALAVSFFLVGLSEGFMDVGGHTNLVWMHGEKVGPLLNGMHFFFGIGAFISPLLVTWSRQLGFGWEGAYWLIGALGIPVTLWLAFLPAPLAPPEESVGEMRVSRLDVRVMAPFVVLFLLYFGIEVGFSSFVFSYATQTGLASESGAAYMTSVFWLMLALGKLATIPLVARMRKQVMLSINLVGASLSLGLILYWQSSSVMLWVGTTILGLFLSPFFSTLMAYAERKLPFTGGTAGWFFAGMSAGGMVIPWLIGQTFTRIGPPTMIWITLVQMVIGLGVLGMLSRQVLVVKEKIERP